MSHVTCHKGERVGTTSTERMRLTRQRRRQGKHHISLLVNEDEVDFLLARGYPLKRTDTRSIARQLGSLNWRLDQSGDGARSPPTSFPALRSMPPRCLLVKDAGARRIAAQAWTLSAK